MVYRRLVLIFSCLVSLSLFAADPSPTPTAPSSIEMPAHPETKTEPVFPIEDLIGKPTKETDRFLSEFVSMLATLGLVLALILFIAWFLKRMVNAKIEEANLTSSIKIIDKRNISPKTSVYMIEVNGKGIIVAESQNGVASLGTYPTDNEDDEMVVSEQKLPRSFEDLLKKQQKRPDQS